MSTGKQKRYHVHVYRPGGTTEFYFDDNVEARNFAFNVFHMDDVYKVKVWDLEMGDIVPNNPKAEALMLELV